MKQGRPRLPDETHHRRGTYKAYRHARGRGTSSSLDPVFLFTHSRDGLDPHIGGYKSRAEAQQAWEMHRRAVWGLTPVGCLPGPALEFDGLTRESRFARQRVAYWVKYDHAFVLAAIECDRAAVRQFQERNPSGAQAIEDYLAQYFAFLDRLEASSRELDGSVALADRVGLMQFGARDTYSGKAASWR